MDSGLITGRYASALLQYAEAEGQGAEVLRDAQSLISLLPALEKYLHRIEGPSAKLQLLHKALPQMCAPLDRFLSLVMDHHREEHLKRMLQDYCREYRKLHGIAEGRLTVASQPSGELIAALEKFTRERRGAQKVEIEVNIDPDIIGGYVYRVGDLRLDASVKRQLREIEKKFETKNKRII